MKNTTRTIHHLLMLLVFLPVVFLPGCATRQQKATPGADPTFVLTTVTDRRGNVTETTTDNRGKAAAAEGQALLTTEEVWKELVTKIPDNESPLYGWTMTETAYSNLDRPNVVKLKQLQDDHKKILAEAASLAEAGATKDYEAAIKSAAAIAGEIAKLLKGNGSGSDEDGDRVSILNRTISVGPNHTVVPLAQATEMGAATRSRHGNQNLIQHTDTTTLKDTSTTEEIVAALDAGVRKEELRLAFTLAQAAIDAKEDPQPGADKTPVVPSEIPGKVEPADVTTSGTQSFLWKPISDSNGKAVVIFPASFNGRIANVTVNGERAVFSSIANGNRTHWRLGKPGSAYEPEAKVSADVDGKLFTVVVDTPSKRTTLENIKPPAKPTPVSEMPKPAEPAATPSDGDAAAPGE